MDRNYIFVVYLWFFFCCSPLYGMGLVPDIEEWPFWGLHTEEGSSGYPTTCFLGDNSVINPVRTLYNMDGEAQTHFFRQNNTSVLDDGEELFDGTVDNHVTHVASLSAFAYAWATNNGTFGWHNTQTGKTYRRRAYEFMPRKFIRVDGKHAHDKDWQLWALGKDGVIEGIGRQDGENFHFLRKLLAPGALLSEGAIDSTQSKSVAFIPKKVFRGCYAVLWSLKYPDGMIRLPEHDGAVLDVTFGPKGKKVFTAGQDGIVHVADVVTGKLLQRIKVVEPVLPGRIFRLGEYSTHDFVYSDASKPIKTVGVSPCGRLLATCDEEDDVLLWDTQTGGFLERVVLPRGMHSCFYAGKIKMVFNPTTTQLLVYNRNYQLRHALRVGSKKEIVPRSERPKLFKRIMGMPPESPEGLGPQAKKQKTDTSVLQWLLRRQTGN